VNEADHRTTSQACWNRKRAAVRVTVNPESFTRCFRACDERTGVTSDVSKERLAVEDKGQHGGLACQLEIILLGVARDKQRGAHLR